MDDEVPQSPTRPPLEDVVIDLAGGDEASLGRRALAEISSVDHAVYRAVAATPTPTLDVPLRHLSNAANRSLLWLGVSGVLAGLGGRRGRRAAVAGLTAVGAASLAVNLGLKQLSERERPDRLGAGVIDERHTKMPDSSSFPSGHSASGFAFATAVGHEIPALAMPLRVLAATVAYSRVHTGVHYPGDTIVGALVGGALGSIVGTGFARATRR
jgi:undecaprenyl-diphosphatase